jgi:hypothetical protein
MIVVLAPAAAHAATTITVDTTDNFAPNHCTLSEAINLANGSSPVGTCTKTGSGALTIEFDSSLVGQTIALMGSPLPDIEGGTNLTIDGPDPSSPMGITISGEGSHLRESFGLIGVNDGATLSLLNLTLTKGRSTSVVWAGAITNHGSLIIANCSVIDNLSVDLSASKSGTTYGAISNGSGAKLTITNSTFSGNQALGSGGADGGAIDNQGNLTITGSTFSANNAASDGSTGDANGGAVYNQGTLTITNSTLAANQASGGPMGLGQGGAIFNAIRATSTITNTTFLGNTAVRPNNKAGRGGAIYTSKKSTLTLKGSILAKSFGGNCYLPLSDGGYNLSDDESCDFSGTSQEIFLSKIYLAAGLGNNGGPTQTIALTSAMSAAVDLIPPLDCPATDQRGFIRPATGQARCDAGAFELGAEPPPP